MDMNMKSRTNLVASRLTLFSIISLVIIETCTLLLVKDYIIFCYIHLVQSDYSTGALNFKMVPLRFVNVMQEVLIKCNGRKYNSEEHK